MSRIKNVCIKNVTVPLNYCLLPDPHNFLLLSTVHVPFKLVCNEKTGGVGKVAYVRYRSRTLAIKVCLSFNFAVVFNYNVFPFRPRKSKLVGDVLMGRQNVATMYMFFFFTFITHIDAPNRRKCEYKIWKL